MSTIWNNLIQCQNDIIDILDTRCQQIEEPRLSVFHKPKNGWINLVWANQSVRRAHIDVVDARSTKGLWMMHVCLFPMLTNPSPIYGFDVIAGKQKMTGAFHDFSPSLDKNHPMISTFFESVKEFTPSKSRELPEWAKNIFTDKMLAASNVKTTEEATSIIRIAVHNLQNYLDDISRYDHTANSNDVIEHQNFYCKNQKCNPHTPRVMKSLGLDDQLVDDFCNNMLFPQIYNNI